MNREEQILAAAKQQYVRKGYTRDAFIAGAQWADEHPKSPWISVEDRLPKLSEDDERLSDEVILLKDNYIFTGYYNYEDEDWTLYGCSYDIIPTHWMPIPELPKV